MSRCDINKTILDLPSRSKAKRGKAKLLKEHRSVLKMQIQNTKAIV